MKIHMLSKIKSRGFVYVACCIAIIGAIVVPYYDYYCIQTNQSSIMGDFNVLGFSLSGSIEIEYAIGNQFTFIGGRNNITVPCGG